MDAHIVSFLNYIRYEKNYSDLTMSSYENDLSQYEDFVTSTTGKFDALAIDVNTVRAWMADMAKNHLSVGTIKRRVCALRSYCRYLRQMKLIESSPLTLLPTPQVPKPLPAWVSEDQMDFLLDEVDYGNDFEGIRDRLVVDMLYSTGMRRAEAAGLKDADVDFGLSQIRVFGKGNKQRLIPFGYELSALMRHYIDLRTAEVGGLTEFFFTDCDGEPLKPYKITKIAQKYLEEIPSLSKRGAHVLRHSFATNMLSNGADLMAVKELLGHASLQSTEVYTHLTPQEIIENYKQAHPRAKTNNNLKRN